MRFAAALALILLGGCSSASVLCSKIANPPFGDRIALAKEVPDDGPVSKKWIIAHAAVLEACGY